MKVYVITTNGVGVMSEKRWTGTPWLMNTAAARLAKRLLLPPLGGWARASYPITTPRSLRFPKLSSK